jgi:hypothetical protein
MADWHCSISAGEVCPHYLPTQLVVVVVVVEESQPIVTMVKFLMYVGCNQRQELN